MSAELKNRKQVDFLGEHMENYNVETSAIHRKLQSKCQALKILREELEKFRTERDQFKLMAETLQLRYSAIKRSSDYNNCGFGGKSSVGAMLHETREKNIKLTTECESLKQKLSELQGDIQLLRGKICTCRTSRDGVVSLERHKLTPSNSSVSSQDEEASWKTERMNFISHLENLKKKNAQLSFDLKALIDEKEEVVTERDAYKCKTHRLNHELQIALKANKNHPSFLDIDGLILENKYLQERLKNSETELDFVKQSAGKYKTMVDTKRRKGIVKLGTNNGESVMSHKQVKSLLEDRSGLPTKTETIADLKALCLALLDSVNDKNLALNHQKKTNKILATKISELEQRILLLSGESCETSDTTFSPSQILLNGYCASAVDVDTKSSNITEDSGTMSSEADDSNKTSRGSDCMDSLSSESGRSILSSEYGNPCSFSDLASIYVHNDQATTSDYIAKERLEDFKDLPPELAAMVQKALNELDMREFDDENPVQIDLVEDHTTGN